MSNSNFIKFCNELDNWLLKQFPTVFAKNTVAVEEAIIAKHLQSSFKEEEDIPELRTTNDYFKIRIPDVHSKRSLLKYCILSWSLPPLARFELQEVLRKRSQQHHFFELISYLQSKEVCYCLLFLETDYRLNDVFGNILQPRSNIWVKTPSGGRQRISVPDEIILELRHQPTPRRKIRRRGYNDHGSMADDSERARRKALEEDEFLTKKHYLMELQRNIEKVKSLQRVFEAETKLLKWGRD